MHVEIPRPRDATELDNDGMIQVRRRPLPKRTEFINFCERDLITDDYSFGSLILSAIDLQCYVFPFEKLMLNH